MTPSSYSRLKWFLILITLALSLVPLFVVGYVIHREFLHTYEDKLTENLRLMTTNRCDAISMFLNERVVQLRMLADIHTYGEMSNQAYLDRVFDALHDTSGSFIDIGVIGQDGGHLAYCGPFDLMQVNYSEEPWFHQAMLKGAVHQRRVHGVPQLPPLHHRGEAPGGRTDLDTAGDHRLRHLHLPGAQRPHRAAGRRLHRQRQKRIADTVPVRGQGPGQGRHPGRQKRPGGGDPHLGARRDAGHRRDHLPAEHRLAAGDHGKPGRGASPPCCAPAR